MLKHTPSVLQPCVSGLFYRRGCVLLVKRLQAPRQGEWSLPGGRLETGETYSQALHREMWEETNLVVRGASPFATITVRNTYHLSCFRVWGWSGLVRAGDDAGVAMWVPVRRLKRFLRPETHQIVMRGVSLRQNDLRSL